MQVNNNDVLLKVDAVPRRKTNFNTILNSYMNNMGSYLGRLT
jgi:hypothetical protein